MIQNFKNIRGRRFRNKINNFLQGCIIRFIQICINMIMILQVCFCPFNLIWILVLEYVMFFLSYIYASEKKSTHALPEYSIFPTHIHMILNTFFYMILNTLPLHSSDLLFEQAICTGVFPDLFFLVRHLVTSCRIFPFSSKRLTNPGFS